MVKSEIRISKSKTTSKSNLLLSVFLLFSLPLPGLASEPLITLVVVDGPDNWSRGAIVGSNDYWELIPHSESHSDILIGCLEGFPGGWAFGPYGGFLEGQGSTLILAAREDWETAVFASSRDSLLATTKDLAALAGTSEFYRPTFRSWENLLKEYSYWVAANAAPRFVLIHLSIVDLPAGSAGSGALVSFWNDLCRIFESNRKGTLIVLYSPESVASAGQNRSLLLRVVTHDPGDMPPYFTPLSSLDIAPSLAHLLDLHLTPDYPGQSLAAWKATGKRIEPLLFLEQDRRWALGTRWLVITETDVDPTSPVNVDAYDLWSSRELAVNLDDKEAMKLLDHLLIDEISFPLDQVQDSVPALAIALQEQAEADSSSVR